MANPVGGKEDDVADQDRQRFTATFHACAPRIRAYARRHTEAHDCDDVVAEVFAIAWRRRAAIPPDPLPWLLVVARNVLANRRRTAARADRLWFAALGELWHTTASTEDDLADRELLLDGLARCTRVEREALLLIAWDGLDHADAAAVAGCSVRAFTVRLSRARARLDAALHAPPTGPSPMEHPTGPRAVTLSPKSPTT